MRVEAGPFIHDTRVGSLHLDRRLDPHQLEILVRSIERGVDPKHALSAEIDEGGATWTFYDPSLRPPGAPLPVKVMRL